MHGILLFQGLIIVFSLADCTGIPTRRSTIRPWYNVALPNRFDQPADNIFNHTFLFFQHLNSLIGAETGSAVIECDLVLSWEICGIKKVLSSGNAACLVETELTPMQCLRETQKIERLLGRTQKSTDGKYHDRPIDLDLLLYDDLQVNEKDLILPHPHMQERDFVMIPLREIMEHWALNIEGFANRPIMFLSLLFWYDKEKMFNVQCSMFNVFL